MAFESDFRFGESGYETMRSVLMATIADFVDVEDAPDEEQVMEQVEKFVGTLPALYRTGVVWVLRGFEVAPLAMGYRRQFSNLSREEQVKVLEAYEQSGNYVQRGIIMLLKTLVLFIYFSEPEMDRALGYDHRCLVEARQNQ